MGPDFPESDWKIFRELRVLALDRFCERTLKEIASLMADDASSNHDRYLAVCKQIGLRDEELARMFNNPRRSTAMLHLLQLRHHKLISDEEMERFSEDIRRKVARNLDLGSS